MGKKSIRNGNNDPFTESNRNEAKKIVSQVKCQAPTKQLSFYHTKD